MSENEFIYTTTNTLIPEQPKQKFISYELVGPNDPVLSMQLDDFNFNNKELDPAEIASRLVETAKTFNSFSVAANQCGLTHKVFVAGNDDEYVAFFNPVITTYSDEEIILPESDLTNPGLVLKIKRPKGITVTYITYEGEIVTKYFDGITARIIQQNIDRLNGTDFKQRVSDFNLKRSKKALDKKIKRYVRNSMRIEKQKG